MKVIGVNGSPRKKWNTALLLEKALEGAQEKDAETELVHLYDLDYKGCVSCFACKLIGGKSYGKCGYKDGLTPLLEKVSEADAIILGSPIYFYTETGEMRSFIERLLFPYLTYTPGYVSIFPRKMPAAMIYTMNVTEENVAKYNQDKVITTSAGAVKRAFGSCETLISYDTYQFDDYSKYLSTVWDADAKAKRRKEIFPKELEAARELGAKLVRK
jgi:multimeric flavodoxin WrbA